MAVTSPSVSEASTVPASDKEARQQALASYEASKAMATPDTHGFNTPPDQVIRRLPTGTMLLGSPQQSQPYTPTSLAVTPACEPASVEPAGKPSASSGVKPVKKSIGKKKNHAKSKTKKSGKVSKGKGKKLNKTGKTKKGKLAGKNIKSKKNMKSKKNSKTDATGTLALAAPGGSTKRPPATPQTSAMPAPTAALSTQVAVPATAVVPATAAMPATAAVPETAAMPATASAPVKREDNGQPQQDPRQSRLDLDTRATLNRAGTSDVLDLATLQGMIQNTVQASLETKSQTGTTTQTPRRKPRDKERHNMTMRFYRSLESSLAA